MLLICCPDIRAAGAPGRTGAGPRERGQAVRGDARQHGGGLCARQGAARLREHGARQETRRARGVQGGGNWQLNRLCMVFGLPLFGTFFGQILGVQ